MRVLAKFSQSIGESELAFVRVLWSFSFLAVVLMLSRQMVFGRLSGFFLQSVLSDICLFDQENCLDFSEVDDDLWGMVTCPDITNHSVRNAGLPVRIMTDA
jgi:hypothetical protein